MKKFLLILFDNSLWFILTMLILVSIAYWLNLPFLANIFIFISIVLAIASRFVSIREDLRSYHEKKNAGKTSNTEDEQQP